MTREPISPDTDLIEDALSGGREAVACLVNRLMPIVRAKVRCALHRERTTPLCPDDGDDLTQDVWLHLISENARRLREFDPTRGVSLEAYVAFLTERALVSRRRRTTAQKRGGHVVFASLHEGDLPAAVGDSPEEHVASAQLATTLHAHLQRQLPERGRLVWQYIFADGRAPPEAAKLIGVDVQVIYNWQHRIRKLAGLFFGNVHTDAYTSRTGS